MRLESGPAGYDRNYYSIFLLLCIGLGIWFYRDYAYKYPEKNVAEARKHLTLTGVGTLPDKFSETPTQSMFENLQESAPTDPAVVHETLGEPFAVHQEAGTTFEYFVSAYGMGEVPVIAGRVQPQNMHWRTWYKSKDQIRMQLYCALVCAFVALLVLLRVYKAATLRAVIDDEGMTYGSRRIPFDTMKRLCDYSRKGWVDLYYDAGGQERKLRIDNQKIRKFNEIINTLCEVKGFEDPRAAAEEAEKPAEPEGPDEAAADESTRPDEDPTAPDDE